MKLRPAVSRRTFIISATLFLLTALFGYYFLAFLPKKESQLIAHRVRALDRVGKNFQEKYEVYRKNIDQKIRAEKVALTDTLQDQKKELIQKRNSLLLKDSSDLKQRKELVTINNSIDSLERKLASLKDVLNQNIQVSKENKQGTGIIRFENYFTTPFNSFFSPLRILDSFDGYVVYQGGKFDFLRSICPREHCQPVRGPVGGDYRRSTVSASPGGVSRSLDRLT